MDTWKNKRMHEKKLTNKKKDKNTDLTRWIWSKSNQKTTVNANRFDIWANKLDETKHKNWLKYEKISEKKND